MSARNSIRRERREAGIALLISIFILLLISVVAISLLVSSGTESAIAGNYRAATAVYYAALAGLEEGRGRLSPKDPNSFKSTAPPGFLPAPGAPFAVGSPVYIINGGNVTPWDSPSTYGDREFQTEFPTYAMPNPAPNVTSVSNAGGIQGPSYKWVRINAVSEASLGFQVAPYDGHGVDPAKPIFYDGTHLTVSNSGPQVLEITSLAVLPNGSQKMVQYLVAYVPITLPPFLAALTLSGSPGSDPVFLAPAENNGYAVKGDDQDCNGNPILGSAFRAIGIYGDYSGGSSGNAVTAVKNGIPPSPPSPVRWDYTGLGAAPDVWPLNPFQTPSQLNAIVQTIIQSADAVVPAGSAATQTAYMTNLGMSPSNMMTVVSNGDLDLTHWGNTGYGLLLVTGTFTMDPDNGWHGIILVIGQGQINNTDEVGDREIDGAVFVAKTNDPSGVALPDPNLGAAYVSFTEDMPGNGIRYSSCWIQKAQPTSSYRILSFHEIPQ